MSLTGCIKKAGEHLHADDKKAILARAKELREQGVGRTEAGRQAVQERVAFVNNEKKTFRAKQAEEAKKAVESAANSGAGVPHGWEEAEGFDPRKPVDRSYGRTELIDLGNGRVPTTLVEDWEKFFDAHANTRAVASLLVENDIENLLDGLDNIIISESETIEGALGMYNTYPNGQKAIALSAPQIDDENPNGTFTLLHELGHAADLVSAYFPADAGLFSSRPELQVHRDPTSKMAEADGPVAKELIKLYALNDGWAFLGYPLGVWYNNELTEEQVKRELFAQLFAAYMISPERVMAEAPLSFQFMERVMNDIRAKNYEKALDKLHRSAKWKALRPFGRSRLDGGGAGPVSGAAQASATGFGKGPGQGTQGGREGGAQASRREAERAIAALPTASRSGAKRLWTTITDAAKKGFYGAAFTWDLADIAKQKLPSVVKYMDLMSKKAAVKTQIEDQVEKIISQAERLSTDERTKVNKFLYDSTISGKWGYKDDPNSNIEVDSDMEQRFNALSPDAKTLVRSVFKHGAETLRNKQRLIKEEINNEFRQQIKDADMEPAKVEELEKKRRAALQHYDSILLLTANKPYAPLRRFGNYAVVARSQQFRDAVANNNTKGIERMQANEDHYFVAFYETAGEAEAQADKLQASGKYVESSWFEKEKGLDAIHNGRDMMAAFQRLRNLIKSELEVDPASELGKSLNSMISDLYLQTLAETSARKAEIERRNVAGADQDMLRAFASQGRADAHFIAALKHNGDVTDAMYEMRREAHGEGKDKADRMRLFNEFMTRHALHMNYQEHRVQDAIMRGTSLWMLATSPAYYLQNATQTPMISVPYLAGKHGYGKSWGAITQAYEDLGPMMTGLKWSDRMDFTKAPADVRQALQDLVAAGRIDIALDQDLGRFHSAGQNGVSHLMYTVDRKLRGMAQRVEAINRVTAAIAAYRMEMAKNGGNHASAVEYASKVVRVTHGDYSAFNSPKYLTPGGGLPAAKLVTQFRKFQIIQASLILRLFNNSFTGDVSPQERAIARKALFFTLGHTVAMGGFYGLPGASALAWVLGKMLSDPDEPDEDEFHLRRAIGNEDIADLILKGAPAYFGLDLSGKLGMGAAFSLMPYAKLDTPSTQDAYKNALLALTGPFAGGLLPRMAEGVNQIGHGNYYKGMEFMLPSGFANVMKGYRYATEGVTRKNGDVVMDAEEVTFATALWQSMGLQTKQLTDRSFDQKVMTEFETFYSDKASRIKEKYARAAKQHDTDAMAAAREQWMQLQDSRMRNGFTRQPLGDLLKTPVQQQRRERQVINHVGSRNNRLLPQELAEI